MVSLEISLKEKEKYFYFRNVTELIQLEHFTLL